MTQIRIDYPELDQRLNLAEVKADLTQSGDFNQVSYLINQFPR